MTDPQRQKSKERSEAFQAMLKLDEEWEFEERESPDFLITSDTGERFGLEVTDAYVGKMTRAGSRLRALEDANHAWLAAMRREYEEHGGVDLHVSYTGSTSPDARDALLAALRDERFEEQSPLSGSATLKLPGGTAYVHRTPHPYWMMLDDRSGDMSNDGTHLQDAIDRKAGKLARYRRVCADARLLVVATKIYNSGKLELEEGFRPHLRGFDAVYFFSYPTESEQDALARFGLSKNWNIVLLSFDPADPGAGPTGIHTVVTDGQTQSIVLQRGRLWKKDRRSAAILLFPESRIAVRLDSRGRLVVGAMASQHHDHGYDLALGSIVAVAARKPGRVPVVGPIGSMVTVQDITTMQHAFANAA